MAGAFRQRPRSGEARLGHARLHGAGGGGSERLGRLPLLPEMRTAMRTDRVILTIGLVGITLLADPEMRDLLTYLYSLHFRDQPGSARRGERLFASKGCATCHRVAGDRPGIGPSLSRVSQYASPILWAGVMWTP